MPLCLTLPLVPRVWDHGDKSPCYKENIPVSILPLRRDEALRYFTAIPFFSHARHLAVPFCTQGPSYCSGKEQPFGANTS